MSEEKNAKKPAASKAAGKNKIENSKSKAKPAEKKTNSPKSQRKNVLKKFRTDGLYKPVTNFLKDKKNTESPVMKIRGCIEKS